MANSTSDQIPSGRFPPLILHPFAENSGSDKLAAGSRASMILQGLLPSDQFNVDELNNWILEGRAHEIRMLYYIGKDLTRWIGQCMEVVERDDQLRSEGIRKESFAEMLVDSPPPAVQEKLRSWGVTDYKSIFRRALGLNAVFAEVPRMEQFTEEFIRHHYRYADHLFECRQQACHYVPISSTEFPFELYASGEYARMLERQWDV